MRSGLEVPRRCARPIPIRVAERLRRALQESFEIEASEVFTSAIAGIAVSTTGYTQPCEVLRDASAALGRAKAGGRPCEIFAQSCRQQEEAFA